MEALFFAFLAGALATFPTTTAAALNLAMFKPSAKSGFSFLASSSGVTTRLRLFLFLATWALPTNRATALNFFKLATASGLSFSLVAAPVPDFSNRFLDFPPPLFGAFPTSSTSQQEGENLHLFPSRR